MDELIVLNIFKLFELNCLIDAAITITITLSSLLSVFFLIFSTDDIIFVEVVLPWI